VGIKPPLSEKRLPLIFDFPAGNFRDLTMTPCGFIFATYPIGFTVIVIGSIEPESLHAIIDIP
jgi:hypothetical protein